MQTNILEYLEATAPRVPNKIAYANGKAPKLERTMALTLDEEGKVTNVVIDVKTESDINYSTNITTNRKGFTPPNAVLKPWIYSVFQNSRINALMKNSVFRNAAKKPPTK